MTAVTVAMKIRVVFVELYVGAAELLISAIGRPLRKRSTAPSQQARTPSSFSLIQ